MRDLVDLEFQPGEVYTKARYVLYPPVHDSGRPVPEPSLDNVSMTSCTAEEAPSLSIADLFKVMDDLEARRPKVHYWTSDTVPPEAEDPDTGEVAPAVWTLARFWRWAYLVDGQPVVVLHPDNEEAFLQACQTAGIKAIRAGVQEASPKEER